MVRLRALRMLALLAALAMLAVGCADDTEEGDGEAADDEMTETEEPTEEPTETDGDGEAEADDGLQLGYLMPETGQLAFLGPAQIKAIQMAVAEINEAGGVLGSDVTLSGADEAGDAAVASASADQLLADDVDAIIGAAASGMSLAVIDKITGAGVLQCSASNTAPTFTGYDDNGLYFRTAPSDALQGPVLAETIIADGHSSIAILGRGDDYGQGLADAAAGSLADSGADVTGPIIYDPEAASFTAEVEQVVAADPDAVVLVSFEEGTQILQGLIEAGYGPGDVGVYGTDGVRDTELNQKVDPANANVLDGMKGTAPDPGATPDFLQRFEEFSDDEEPIFSAQAYDCANMIALAAVAAGSSDGQAIAAEMNGLLVGDNECATFGECADFLANGETVDYQAASGVGEFTDAGEPNSGTYEVWGFVDGELESLDSVEITLE